MLKPLLRPLAAVALAAGLLTPAAAAPVTTSLTAGYTFQPYTGQPAVGAGLVDTDRTLFYVEERTVDDVASWLIFFDPATRGSRVQATITFDSDIVATERDWRDLIASTPAYGIDIDGDAVLDDYAFRAASGLEGFQDTLSWEPGTRTLTIDWRAEDPGDHIRVLVAAPALQPPLQVPEPTSIALAVGALLAAGVARRRRVVER